jgi:carboxypeptidase Taq
MFGTSVPSDKEGVLQDVHWSAGLFGYFPTYALGNLISAMLFTKAQRDLPTLMKEIEKGDFTSLLQWLRQNVHKHGCKYSANELIKIVTGREISTDDFVHYLQTKYSDLYKL